MQVQFIHETLSFSPSPSLQHDNDSLLMQQISNPPYHLTLSLNLLLAPSRKSPTHLPRPQNSFVLFRKDYNTKMRQLNRNSSNKLSAKIISENAKVEWSRQPPTVKNFFKVLAKEADKRHKEMFPHYKYQPKCKSRDNRDENEESASPINSESLEDTTHVVEIDSTSDNNDSIGSDTDMFDTYFDYNAYCNN
ncbi:22611_t:CDS:1 [Dentiscutata erythropus]|uniref:22611_t:CDS:1 n=1 Tax=Dentiscutata erythropus TaxID=1348616 RepID=A0A9N8WFQ7_9GLOM|nr:22611_t:CDS:1 [Dentiscutata erythropus]